jgi:hypothetical protein
MTSVFYFFIIVADLVDLGFGDSQENLENHDSSSKRILTLAPW